jgi:hypothetical protein
VRRQHWYKAAITHRDREKAKLPPRAARYSEDVPCGNTLAKAIGSTELGCADPRYVFHHVPRVCHRTYPVNGIYRLLRHDLETALVSAHARPY